MRVFIIEPYYAGSHRAWADGWSEVSGHEIHLVTMEGRFWKWRMHGGPITVAAKAVDLAASVGPPDVVVASSMLDLASFLGLAGSSLGNPPSMLYMHENQLTYPLSPRTRGEDLSYAFINWRSMVAADHIIFNSHYHKAALFEALRPFLKNFPDYRQTDLIESVEGKTDVIGVGIGIRTSVTDPTHPPLIIWNQRWEYDKNPSEMFEILYAVADRGVEFRLAITGENFRQTPTEFEQAQQRLSDHIIWFGFADQAQYDRLVSEAEVVLSTAHHEFFGIGVAEAIAAGAYPVLPSRLSYPELIPETLHSDCLYDTTERAIDLVATAISDVAKRKRVTSVSRSFVRKFAWETIGPRYDDAVQAICRR